MHRLFRRLALAASLALLPAVALAQSGPVVVELFTSQGCSSCPPADDYLAEIAARENVLPLAFHVDYWDKLGWRDTFSDPAFTKRQYVYGKRFHNRSVWTPQFVVEGREYSRGSFRDMVDGYIAQAARRPDPVRVTAKLKAGVLVIRLESLASNLPAMDVVVANYLPSKSVNIERGENAGQSVAYHNVVRDWKVVDRWQGSDARDVMVSNPGELPLAVLVQAEGQGPIMAAVDLRQ